MYISGAPKQTYTLYILIAYIPDFSELSTITSQYFLKLLPRVLHIRFTITNRKEVRAGWGRVGEGGEEKNKRCEQTLVGTLVPKYYVSAVA